ncbi:YybH family protein [Caldimonas tepidiphila]|uniref:YybH family protein n=1 Tax=Caldimonas tepidiphila TaxID=2315841 RepID=UPI000E5A18CF|nr:nuclear transport factor 2 family protein [Caldimonas tepidiphila]
MPSPKPPPASPDHTELQFYEALQQGDLDRLMSLWADDEEIVCVHPGGQRLVGSEAIRAAFDAMFSQGAVPVYPEQVRRVQTLDSAVHSVLERVQTLGPDGEPHTGWALATNVYVKTPLGWRMVCHHASPSVTRELAEVTEQPVLLH